MSEAYSSMRPAASTDNDPSLSCTGIDDGPFLPRTSDRPRYAPLVAVQLTGPHITRLSTSWIIVDGLDATRKAVALLDSLPKNPILLSGVTFGGFNIIDPVRIHSHFRVPTIVVTGSRPDNRSVRRALVKHFPDWRERWEIIRWLGPLRKVRSMPAEPPVFYEALGCSAKKAEKILISNAYVSRLPEPIRVAGLVARGLYGETTRTLA